MASELHAPATTSLTVYSHRTLLLMPVIFTLAVACSVTAAPTVDLTGERSSGAGTEKVAAFSVW